MLTKAIGENNSQKIGLPHAAEEIGFVDELVDVRPVDQNMLDRHRGIVGAVESQDRIMTIG